MKKLNIMLEDELLTSRSDPVPRGRQKQFLISSKPATRQKNKFLSVGNDQMVTNKRIILGVITRKFVAEAVILVLLAAGLACWPSSSLADPIYAYQVPSTASFGDLDQADMQDALGTALASQACGPIAAVNSMVFLQNLYPQIYDNTLVGDSPDDWIYAADMLVDYMDTNPNNGTQDTAFLNGIISFMNAQAPGMTATVHSVITSTGHTPTWNFIYNYLTQNQAVQILLSSSSSSGHYLSVKSITWDAGEGMGTIGVIDPATGLTSNLDIALDPDSKVLSVDYGGIALPIIAEYEESPIPEPATLLLLGLGAVIVRRKRS